MMFAQNQKIGKRNNVNSLLKPNGLKQIVKIVKGYLCLDENLNFDNYYII